MSYDIQLTQGYTATVDDDMAAFLCGYKWFAVNNRVVYAAKAVNRKVTFMHHVIAGYPLYGSVIDHINGNSLDNRRANLRLVSQRVNMSNTVWHRTGKVPGVRWRKDVEKWEAYITVNQKFRYLGLFADSSAAAHARKEAERVIR